MMTKASCSQRNHQALTYIFRMQDDVNAVVTYHNPLDNVPDLAHIFFARCRKNCNHVMRTGDLILLSSPAYELQIDKMIPVCPCCPPAPPKGMTKVCLPVSFPLKACLLLSCTRTPDFVRKTSLSRKGDSAYSKLCSKDFPLQTKDLSYPLPENIDIYAS